VREKMLVLSEQREYACTCESKEDFLNSVSRARCQTESREAKATPPVLNPDRQSATEL
jgi:hypothetical protein